MRYSSLVPCLMGLTVALAAGAEEDFEQFNTAAGTPASRPAENIALNAPYTLHPRPNYSYCTDRDDASQITDGVYSEGYFWVQKSTVGWRNQKPVIITIDLGAVRPIRGASFNTAAGRAGVAWPTSIAVFVAGDDKRFYNAGDLVALSTKHGHPDPQEYRTYRYWTEELRTFGRYVALVVSAQPFLFVDEIEVYLGEPEWLDAAREGEPVADIKAHVLGLAIQNAVARRLRRDIEEVRSKSAAAGVPDEVRSAVAAELDAVEAGIASLPADYGGEFRAILPLDAGNHEGVFRAQARLWEAAGLAPLTIWNADPWGMLEHLADPPRDDRPEVRVHLMLNEFRAGAFNVSNASQKPMDLSVRITGLPGGPNPKYIAVHEVQWTDTQSGVPVAAALPEAPQREHGYAITVPSGMTRQVWLTFHPEDVPPGEHQGFIALVAGDHSTQAPITMVLYPVRFPDEPTLHFGGWDYTDAPGLYELTNENRAAIVKHLRTHFVDSPWGTSGTLPHGTYDEEGTMTAAPATQRFDDWVARWPEARQYLVFAAVTNRLGTFGIGAPAFDRAVKSWVTFWADHARERGIAPEKIGLLLVDEPHRPEQDQVILAWANALKAAGTGVRVWEDPTYKDVTEANSEMVAVCDVLCPNRPIFLRGTQTSRDYYLARRDAGTTLEFYSCSGPSTLLDPYGYYRLQAWTCWQYGASASYFWSFIDGGGASSWNEYVCKRNCYAPMFLDAGSVTAAKQMEACREGIEDYEYLVMLREAVGRAEDNESGAVAKGRALLAELPGRVCAPEAQDTFQWSQPLDRTVADRARIEILEALARISHRTP